MAKLLCNPFFVYVTSFALVFAVYSLGWSNLYPSLSFPLVLFFFMTFIVSCFFGFVVHVLRRIEYKEITWNERTIFYLLLVLIGYLAEFVYNKGVPLQMLLQGVEYDYTSFGIPTFHVFLVTFSSFLSVYIFHQLCSDFNKKRLIYFLLSVIPPVLIISRGTLFMMLTSCLFVYLLSIRTIKLKIVLGIFFLVLLVFYLFGVMGNLRQSKGVSTTSEIMLETSMATNSFKNSFVPKEFIWSYLYISSPLANLQNATNHAQVEYSFGSFLNYEILPDFISKRIEKISTVQKKDVPRIAGWLTVSTFYARSYVFLGWIGILTIFVFFIGTTFTYIFLLRKGSKYYVTGLSILNTLVLFNTFDNMYAFTGLNFQLIYPLLFSVIELRKFTWGNFKLN